jgi:hypothetical protein
MRPSLEYEPLMPAAFIQRVRDSESKFKRHIEPGRPRRTGVKLYSGQIVERIATPPNQANDPGKPPFASGKLDCGAWEEAKAAQSGDEREVETFIF